MKWNTTWINNIWYGNTPAPWWLRCFSQLYKFLFSLKKSAFQFGLSHAVRLPVPVIVVGNITVGGAGKTPLVIALVEELRARGWRPGVISRGYGGSKRGACLLNGYSKPSVVGDEPCLIYKRTAAPVAIGRNRIAAAQLLLEKADINLLIADDGLQHLRLARDVEICVVDGQRRFGNGELLPAGPLRELLEQLNSVDFIVCNGDKPQVNEIPMTLVGDKTVNLLEPTLCRSLYEFSGQRVHAVAGIGHPQRFAQHLHSYGIDVDLRAFPDHHLFASKDISFTDDLPVLMTEKDAVKCHDFACASHWYVPVRAELPTKFYETIFMIVKNSLLKS